MRPAPMLLAILLTACGGGDTGPGPGGVTAEEARELNEAAEMLDANSVSLDALNQGTPR